MVTRLLIFFAFFFQISAYSQSDSIWNVMILKKENQPVIKDNTAEYSNTGFFLYRNCFYDLKFVDNTIKTLRLIDIKPDTLIFIGISDKMDSSPSIVSTDTFSVDYRTIDKLLLVKNWTTESSKKVDCKGLHFIFYKSLISNNYNSKLAFVFPDFQSEIIPRLSSHGITYHYEFSGKLYYHSGIKVQVPRFDDEEKIKTLKGVMTVLDLIVNKRINVTIQK